MLSMKETFAYAGAFYMLSKLYFSSLLATLSRREKIRTQMDATSLGIVSVPLQTSNSSGLKGIGSGLVIRGSKSGNESCTSRSAISQQQQNDSEYQVGGVGLELGLCSKSSLGQGHVEINVETDMDPKEDHDFHLRDERTGAAGASSCFNGLKFFIRLRGLKPNVRYEWLPRNVHRLVVS
ncbi:hypothetical protein C8J57DRAFT_1468427 [Mycena rebaudengoi]|nr:hypothetical protein C8J57DRAFT_1468427 [Mycena rebaudengoi]